jgi:hypothetical protein
LLKYLRAHLRIFIQGLTAEARQAKYKDAVEKIQNQIECYQNSETTPHAWGQISRTVYQGDCKDLGQFFRDKLKNIVVVIKGRGGDTTSAIMEFGLIARQWSQKCTQAKQDQSYLLQNTDASKDDYQKDTSLRNYQYWQRKGERIAELHKYCPRDEIYKLDFAYLGDIDGTQYDGLVKNLEKNCKNIRQICYSNQYITPSQQRGGDDDDDDDDDDKNRGNKSTN